ETNFQNFHLNNALCVNPNTNTSIYTKTNDFSENYLKFTFRLCSDTNCASYEDILERLYNLNLYLYIKHQYLDSSNLDHPIKTRLSIQIWTFDDTASRKRDSFYFSSNYLRDYNNLLMTLSEPVFQEYISFSQKDTVRNLKIGPSDK